MCTLAIIATFSFLGGFASNRLSSFGSAHAQPSSIQEKERLAVRGVDIIHRQRRVGEFNYYPYPIGGLTTLALLDGSGTAGMVLSVSDRPNTPRALIQFFDATGREIGRLDGISPTIPRRQQGMIPKITRQPPLSGKADGYVTSGQLDDIVNWVKQIQTTVEFLASLQSW